MLIHKVDGLYIDNIDYINRVNKLIGGKLNISSHEKVCTARDTYLEVSHIVTISNKFQNIHFSTNNGGLKYKLVCQKNNSVSIHSAFIKCLDGYREHTLNDSVLKKICSDIGNQNKIGRRLDLIITRTYPLDKIHNGEININDIHNDLAKQDVIFKFKDKLINKKCYLQYNF